MVQVTERGHCPHRHGFDGVRANLTNTTGPAAQSGDAPRPEVSALPDSMCTC
jgi:hypothetical protein